MAEMDYRREINEATYAGQEALRCLEQAKDCLSSAGNWGIVDMLGGGMITTFIKRSKMRDADALVQQARAALKRFQRELMDVDNIPEFHIQTGDFLTFADFSSVNTANSNSAYVFRVVKRSDEHLGITGVFFRPGDCFYNSIKQR